MINVKLLSLDHLQADRWQPLERPCPYLPCGLAGLRWLCDRGQSAEQAAVGADHAPALEEEAPAESGWLDEGGLLGAIVGVGVGLVDVDHSLLDALAFLGFHLESALALALGLRVVVELLAGVVVLLLEDLAPERRRRRLRVRRVHDLVPVVQEQDAVVGVGDHAARGRHHLSLLGLLDRRQRPRLLPQAPPPAAALPEVVNARPRAHTERVGLNALLRRREHSPHRLQLRCLVRSRQRVAREGGRHG